MPPPFIVGGVSLVESARVVGQRGAPRSDADLVGGARRRHRVAIRANGSRRPTVRDRGMATRVATGRGVRAMAFANVGTGALWQRNFVGVLIAYGAFPFA
jgi:hypothetical protein